MIDSLEHRGGRAQRGAWIRGYLSGCHGEPKECPYVDKRDPYKNSVTFSRSFVRWWKNGFEYGAIHRRQVENWKKELKGKKGIN